MLQVLCWFNPLLLLYLRALADTHEYLADQQCAPAAWTATPS